MRGRLARSRRLALSVAPRRYRPTAGVLLERCGQVLLVRRGAEPARGRWDVPGGFLEAGESPEDAARREIREELGVELHALRLVLAEINPLADGSTVLDLVFAARFTGEPVAGDDAAEIGWFPWDRLPADLAFDTTRRILGKARRATAPRGLRLLSGEEIVLDERRAFGRFEAPLGGVPRGWVAESGEWSVHDGALCGRIVGERPAAAWLGAELRGDHAIAFEAATVAPSAQDLNAYWEGSGSLAGAGAACTIGGACGWGGRLSGIERHPAETPRSVTSLLLIEPSERHEIVGGRRGATDFLFVDGALVAQVDDATSPRRARSRVALATWNSHVHVFRAAAYELA